LPASSRVRHRPAIRRLAAWLVACTRHRTSGLLLVIGFVTAHAVLWTFILVNLKAAQDIHMDVAEAFGWGQKFQLGYGKHPPLAGWVAGLWFKMFPIADWATYALAMATLGLGIIVSIVLTTEDKITGGPDGMAVPPLALFGWIVQGERVWYWLAGGMLLLAVWLALNLIESPSGRALRALHGSEVAAETLGIPSARYKLQVFVLSAVFTAVAGALTAHYAGFITPAKSSFMHSVELVIMVVFGGMASVFGAVVGAAVLTILPQFLTVLKDYEMMVFGAVLVGTMSFFPQGIVPSVGRWWARRQP